ncbi:MAG: hypothetical protein WAM91_11355 [Candidatus Acidiferrales bacterium]
MRKIAGGLFMAGLVLAAAPLLGQRGGMGMGMAPPTFNGIWNPIVGAGSAYEMVQKDGTKQEMQIAIVKKETVDGKDGFWLEFLMDSKDGQTAMQQLMLKDGEQVTVSKMVVQTPGQPPMEISMQMMGMMAGRGGGMAPPAKAFADARANSERVGNESITTPAGTFDCEHFRQKDGSGDFWISPKVYPWAVVKATGTNGNMLLIKVITDAKSHITGTPIKMEDMMRGRGPGL